MARPSTPLLSRDLIIDQAMKIVDAEGSAGLSMRRLAADLGVSGPSLYHHFVNKDEILDAIIDKINSQIRVREIGPGWERVLTSYAYQLRALLIAHPHVVEFMALRPVTSPSALKLYEHIYQELIAGGWEASFAREIKLAVENLVFGAALMASAPEIPLTAEQEAAYPRLAELRRNPRNIPDDGFEIGFRALVEGLRRLTANAALEDSSAALGLVDEGR